MTLTIHSTGFVERAWLVRNFYFITSLPVFQVPFVCSFQENGATFDDPVFCTVSVGAKQCYKILQDITQWAAVGPNKHFSFWPEQNACDKIQILITPLTTKVFI